MKTAVIEIPSPKLHRTNNIYELAHTGRVPIIVAAARVSRGVFAGKSLGVGNVYMYLDVSIAACNISCIIYIVCARVYGFTVYVCIDRGAWKKKRVKNEKKKIRKIPSEKNSEYFYFRELLRFDLFTCRHCVTLQQCTAVYTCVCVYKCMHVIVLCAADFRRSQQKRFLLLLFIIIFFSPHEGGIAQASPLVIIFPSAEIRIIR